MSDQPIARTSKGLVDALFDSIDALNKKEIDAEHARAVALSAKAIVGVATFELGVRKFEREIDTGPAIIESLRVDALPAA